MMVVKPMCVLFELLFMDKYFPGEQEPITGVLGVNDVYSPNDSILNRN